MHVYFGFDRIQLMRHTVRYFLYSYFTYERNVNRYERLTYKKSNGFKIKTIAFTK